MKLVIAILITYFNLIQERKSLDLKYYLILPYSLESYKSLCNLQNTCNTMPSLVFQQINPSK